MKFTTKGMYISKYWTLYMRSTLENKTDLFEY